MKKKVFVDVDLLVNGFEMDLKAENEEDANEEIEERLTEIWAALESHDPNVWKHVVVTRFERNTDPAVTEE